MTGRPYDEVADLLEPEAYQRMAATVGNPVGSDMTLHPLPAAELRPLTTPGPGYDKQASLELIRARYQNAAPIVQYTLPRIRANPGFRATIEKLRDEGWLDWHLLSAIATHVANHRLRQAGHPASPKNQESTAQALEVMRRPEYPDDPQIPAEEFSIEVLRRSLQMSAMSTVIGLGLQVHQSTPDFRAILALLGARYGYWSDDVDHEDFFG